MASAALLPGQPCPLGLPACKKSSHPALHTIYLFTQSCEINLWINQQACFLQKGLFHPYMVSVGVKGVLRGRAGDRGWDSSCCCSYQQPHLPIMVLLGSPLLPGAWGEFNFLKTLGQEQTFQDACLQCWSSALSSQAPWWPMSLHQQLLEFHWRCLEAINEKLAAIMKHHRA